MKQVRWTAAEWAEVERLAAAAGVRPSKYIRTAVLRKRLDREDVRESLG